MPENSQPAFGQRVARTETAKLRALSLAACLAAAACTHTTEQDNAGNSNQLQSSAHGKNFLKSDSLTNDTLIKLLPENISSGKRFANSAIGQRLTRMTGREFTPHDVQTLTALRALLIAQREAREQRAAQTRELAKLVLKTEHLSTQIYAKALRFLALADVMTLSEDTNVGEEMLARHPKSEFNSFQALQCSIACQTHGWQILAREDSAILTAAGYRQRLLSEEAFATVGQQQPSWLKTIFSQSIPVASKKDKVEDQGKPKQSDTPVQRVSRLRALVENKQWTQASLFAKKILGERSGQSQTTNSKNECPADALYAQYAIAQATRIAQDRKTFARLQDELVRELDRSRCSPEAFAFDKEQFDSFKLDARLWLARLQWEQNKNPEAFHSARQVLNEATVLQAWEHVIDAAKVLIGRVGFEMLNPTENISFLSALEPVSSTADSEDFQVWLISRRGLMQFLDGDFASAQKSFERVIDLTSDTSMRAMAFYWIGRSHHAANRLNDGENALLSSGMTDPLSIYDIFSGQLMARDSGRASTQAKQAFYSSWQTEHESWLQLNERQPLKIIASTQPRTRLTLQSEKIPSTVSSQSQFDNSLETAIMVIALLRAANPAMTQDEFSQFLAQSTELLPSLLKGETVRLRQSFQRQNTLHDEVIPRAHQVAWLTHMLGDHSSSILFVGRLRETLGWDSDYLPFLYFIFYPRPFSQEFNAAAEKCSVDVDLLYAIARQESLFQPAVRSHVGAVGLMQLLPTTASRVLTKTAGMAAKEKFDLTNPATNTIAGACYLKQLLDRYNNNMTFAVAAYNAGEAAVDSWVGKRQKLADMPFFIEFIPFAETKTYVQRVLRNYYNIKWIYRSSPEK
ncbi:MAG: murein transglycosylase [Pseudomonadota bacterium]